MTMTAADHLHTEQELADAWDVSIDTVRRARKRGEVKTLTLGHAIRIPHAEFMRLTGQDLGAGDPPKDDDHVTPIRRK